MYNSQTFADDTTGTIREIIGIASNGLHYVTVTYLGGETETMQRADFDDNYRYEVDPAILATLDNPNVTTEHKVQLLQAKLDYLTSIGYGDYCDARR